MGAGSSRSSKQAPAKSHATADVAAIGGPAYTTEAVASGQKIANVAPDAKGAKSMQLLREVSSIGGAAAKVSASHHALCAC
jgi:hypothetical protein